MIRVNLLPPEYRKADGPPVGRVVALVVGAFLVASALGGWGYVHFGVLADAERQRADLEETLAQIKQQAETSQALLREFGEYQRRRAEIEKIGAARILWSKKLDELADIIHNKGDQKEFLVWLQNLRTTAGTGPDSPVAIAFNGLSGGSLTQLAAFSAKIKDSREFFDDFHRISPPAGNQVKFDDKRYPSVGWNFSFTLDHKQPTWREKQGQ